MNSADAAWALFTRLGEAQILLPAMAGALLWLACSAPTRPLAQAWLGSTVLAAGITTLSKLAFIGWGWGHAPTDFTGFSGHAMFAAAVLPVLARMAASRARVPWPRLALGAGLLVAAAVAWSRVETRTHSVSEVVAGYALGASASLLALRGTPAPALPTPRWLGAGLVAWLLALPLAAPASRTHDWVTGVALRASGRSVPYTRQHLHGAPRLRPAESVSDRRNAHGTTPA